MTSSTLKERVLATMKSEDTEGLSNLRHAHAGLPLGPAVQAVARPPYRRHVDVHRHRRIGRLLFLAG